MRKSIPQAGVNPQPLLSRQTFKETTARFVFTLTACISILAVKRGETARMLNSPNYIFNAEDSLMVMGTEADMAALSFRRK